VSAPAKLKWTKTADGWISIGALLTARVGDPIGPLQFSHWSVYENDLSWGSGGTSSVRQSKRQAELEIARVYALKARGASDV
jgi:hypothetical protein